MRGWANNSTYLQDASRSRVLVHWDIRKRFRIPALTTSPSFSNYTREKKKPRNQMKVITLIARPCSRFEGLVSNIAAKLPVGLQLEGFADIDTRCRYGGNLNAVEGACIAVEHHSHAILQNFLGLCFCQVWPICFPERGRYQCCCTN